MSLTSGSESSLPAPISAFAVGVHPQHVVASLDQSVGSGNERKELELLSLVVDHLGLWGIVHGVCKPQNCFNVRLVCASALTLYGYVNYFICLLCWLCLSYCHTRKILCFSVMCRQRGERTY